MGVFQGSCLAHEIADGRSLAGKFPICYFENDSKLQGLGLRHLLTLQAIANIVELWNLVQDKGATFSGWFKISQIHVDKRQKSIPCARMTLKNLCILTKGKRATRLHLVCVRVKHVG